MSAKLIPVIWTMHMANGDWYPVQPTERCTPEIHGELNPHVIEIRDETGATIWKRMAS